MKYQTLVDIFFIFCIGITGNAEEMTQADNGLQSVTTQIQHLEDRISLLQQDLSELRQIISERSQEPTKAEIVRFREALYDTYTVDIRRVNLRFFWKKSSGQQFGSLQQVKDYVGQQGQRLLFATNAGIFTQQQAPEGLFIADGQELVPINLRNGNGNFYLKPNGVFILSNDGASIFESTEYVNACRQVSLLTSSSMHNGRLIEGRWYKDIFQKHLHGSIKAATQSGPMLVIDGKIHPAFREESKNTYTRSGVGVIDSYTVTFAISHAPVNLYSFAMLFKEHFQCQNALYLDGAICRMYIPELNRYELDGNFAGIIGIIQSN